jgi:hypothetical protein
LLVGHLPSSVYFLFLELVLPKLIAFSPNSLELAYLPKVKLLLFVDGVIIIGDISLIFEFRVSLLIFLLGVSLLVLFQQQFGRISDASAFALLFSDSLVLCWLAVGLGDEDWLCHDGWAQLFLL